MTGRHRGRKAERSLPRNLDKHERKAFEADMYAFDDDPPTIWAKFVGGFGKVVRVRIRTSDLIALDEALHRAIRRNKH